MSTRGAGEGGSPPNLRASEARVLPAESRIAPISAGPHAVIYDSGPPEIAKRKIAFLFPGQGAQRLDLFGAIRARFPKFGENFSKFDDAVAGILERSLAHYVY